MPKPKKSPVNCLGYLVDPDCNYQKPSNLNGTKDVDCPVIDEDQLNEEVINLQGEIGIDWSSEYTLQTRAPTFFEAINWEE